MLALRDVAREGGLDWDAVGAALQRDGPAASGDLLTRAALGARRRRRSQSWSADEIRGIPRGPGHRGRPLSSSTEDELRRFAEAYDPQWFHVDPEAAAHGPFGGLIASGWHTCAIAMRLAVDRILTGSESFASPGVAYINWPNPVRAGDSLTLKAEVLETRRSRSQPDLGILNGAGGCSISTGRRCSSPRRPACST